MFKNLKLVVFGFLVAGSLWFGFSLIGCAATNNISVEEAGRTTTTTITLAPGATTSTTIALPPGVTTTSTTLLAGVTTTTSGSPTSTYVTTSTATGATTTTLAPWSGNPTDPPATRVKLIFVHHSCGENWLEDIADFEWAGGLGSALEDNNYYVSDTYYGWTVDGDDIGGATDTTDWPRWFNLDDQRFFNALRTESGIHSTEHPFTRTVANPGGENQIIMFKSCYPNSEVGGSIADEQAIYNSLLPFFRAHPEKLFILATPPGDRTVSSAANTRTLCNWLVATDGWLNGYAASDGSHNVAVFDFYCVLSETGSHHRYTGGAIQHTFAADYDGASPYHDGDDHPNGVGNQKATTEFVPLLNYYYHRWKGHVD